MSNESSALPWTARHKNLLAAALLVLAVAFLYTPSAHGGFLWDDWPLLFNSDTKTPGPSPGFGKELQEIWSGQRVDFFPLTSTLFLIESRIWQQDPLGYHAVNVALHAVATVLLWAALKRLRVRGAWIGALLFAVHPVCVESVAWISEGKDTLSFALYAGSILAYLQFEESPHPWRFALSLSLFLLSLLAKTAGATLPLVLLLCAWWQRGKVTRQDLILSLPFFAASIGLGLVTVHTQAVSAQSAQAIPVGSMMERLLQAGQFFWFYLGKAVFPQDLMALYPRFTPLGVAPDLALLAAGLALWTFRGTRWVRCAGFGLAYYAISLAPVLGLFRMSFWIYAQVADRFQHFALIGITALAGAALASIPGGLVVRAGAAGVVTAALAWATVLQQRPYQDEVAFWQRQVELTPLSASALDFLGNAEMRADHFEEARTNLETALALDPDNGYVHFDLGQMELYLNRPGDAAIELEAARRLRPGSASVAGYLGVANAELGRFPEAEREFRASLELDPRVASVHENLGAMLLVQGHPSEAADEYREALRLNPNLKDARAQLEKANRASGGGKKR